MTRFNRLVVQVFDWSMIFFRKPASTPGSSPGIMLERQPIGFSPFA